MTPLTAATRHRWTRPALTTARQVSTAGTSADGRVRLMRSLTALCLAWRDDQQTGGSWDRVSLMCRRPVHRYTCVKRRRSAMAMCLPAWCRLKNMVGPAWRVSSVRWCCRKKAGKPCLCGCSRQQPFDGSSHQRCVQRLLCSGAHRWFRWRRHTSGLPLGHCGKEGIGLQPRIRTFWF